MEDTDFFEQFYQRAERSADAVPWASLSPSPVLAEWLARSERRPGAAVVVACGLGDDAEALAEKGWNVTAFDIAPTAIDWARERFPDSQVEYVVADLLDLPSQWSQAFSLVVEVFTIQSIAPPLRPGVVEAIADLVAPSGTLLLSAIGADKVPGASGPPWPLARSDLGALDDAGLTEIRLTREPSAWDGLEHFAGEYERPQMPTP